MTREERKLAKRRMIAHDIVLCVIAAGVGVGAFYLAEYLVPMVV